MDMTFASDECTIIAASASASTQPSRGLGSGIPPSARIRCRAFMPAETSSSIVIAPVKNEGELMQALAVREVVFIEEQSVPEDMERDEEDRVAYHLLAVDKGHAIGTGRLVTLKEPPAGETGQWGRVGRMAVLQAYRKSGVG